MVYQFPRLRPPFSWPILVSHRAIPSFSRVKSQLKRLARALYSNPPVHGARIVAYVVGNNEIFDEWKKEMAGMAGRIQAVRATLVEELTKRDTKDRDWSFITSQIGMFSFTGLKPAQVPSRSRPVRPLRLGCGKVVHVV